METAERGDKVVDGNYYALPDPVSDRIFALFMSLTAEVWTVRDRLRLLERALTSHGIQVDDLIESDRSSESALTAMREDRSVFVERLFAQIATKVDVEAP